MGKGLAALLALLLAVVGIGSAVADAAQAPGSPQPIPVVLDGTRAVVRWRNPDLTTTRVVVRRLAGTVAPASPADGDPVFDGAPTADLQAVGDTVVVGATYTYGYWSYAPDGTVSAETTHSIRATAPPLLTAPAIVSSAGPGAAFRLSWGNPANPPGNPYTVKYATRDAAGVLSAPVIWLLDTSTTQAVFGAAAGPFAAATGVTYQLEVLSQDPYGNDTEHAVGSVVEPYDTRAAGASHGWRTLFSARRWAGTVAVSSTPGAAMTWHASGTEVSVIADRCPGCGKALVRVDGKVRAVVDTHAATLSVRQIVGTVAHLAAGPHTISVQVVGSTGHPAVHLDGVAVLD